MKPIHGRSKRKIDIPMGPAAPEGAAVRQIPPVLAVLAALATCLLIGMAWAGAEPAFAEISEEYVAVDAAMDVYLDDTLLRSYTAEDFAALEEKDPSGAHTYTGYNTFPTAKTVRDAAGVSVDALLRDALGSQRFDSLGADQCIEFTARDGVTERFLKGQLGMARYQFPGFVDEQGRLGAAVLPSSSAGAVQVPAIISLTESGQSYEDDSDVGRLLFGQVSPHEQNHAAFLKELAPQKVSVRKGREDRVPHSVIRVRTAAAQAWNPIRKTSLKTGSKVTAGTELDLDLSVNAFNSNGGGRYWVYYTLDGSTPTPDSAIYNYNSYGGSQQAYNHPILSKYGKVTLKTMVCGYGKKDSSVSVFRYTVVPGTPVISKLILKKASSKKPAPKKRAILVKWKASTGAQGYQIWRAEKKKGKYKAVKTVKGRKTTSWTNKGLKNGKTYYYKIRAYRLVSGKKVYSSYSAVKYKRIK